MKERQVLLLLQSLFLQSGLSFQLPLLIAIVSQRVWSKYQFKTLISIIPFVQCIGMRLKFIIPYLTHWCLLRTQCLQFPVLFTCWLYGFTFLQSSFQPCLVFSTLLMMISRMAKPLLMQQSFLECSSCADQFTTYYYMLCIIKVMRLFTKPVTGKEENRQIAERDLK